MAAAKIAALDLWMNGQRVGRWERSRTQLDRLTYDQAWRASPEGRPLSLSLPFTETGTHSGAKVTAYFENLIPDNEQILRRLRDRFGARSTGAFDLLVEIGRDCAGAVQLVEADSNPGDVHRIDADPLDEAQVAALLRAATVAGRPASVDVDAFRLSIAGAQEKTTLLRHRDGWCIPRGATPSTHIFKLPLGVVGNVQADMRDSVDNEWLCMEIMRELGFDVAFVEIGQFEEQRTLIVERFDRRLSPNQGWWLRLPQEDMCQALGLPPSRKYEADGGPGIRRIMEILRGSEEALLDRTTFFRAHLTFWMLAATDGHAKNFSLALLAGGRYRMTPIYDVLSTYPIQGRGTNQLDPRTARLAMAVDGRNRHDALHEIHRWHWVAMAERLGLEAPAADLIDATVEHAPAAIDAVGRRLPARFPARVIERVRQGVLDAIAKLGREPNGRP